MIGLVFAFVCSYILKRLRSLSKSPVGCTLIFCFGYLSYLTAEMNGRSGIIAILTCSMVMANYAWFNLSPQGKQSSVIIFKFLGHVVEGLVFSYIGLTFWSYRQYRWSTELISGQFVILILGRAAGTIGIFFLTKRNDEPQILSFKDVIYVFYSGLMRGSIAFGLLLRINNDLPDREIILTTCLTIIVVTTIIFGSTTGLLARMLLFNNYDSKQLLLVESKSNISAKLDLSDKSQIKDPLLPQKKGEKRNLTFLDYVKRFDEYILRPIFIYNYEKGQLTRMRKFYELYTKNQRTKAKVDTLTIPKLTN